MLVAYFKAQATQQHNQSTVAISLLQQGDRGSPCYAVVRHRHIERRERVGGRYPLSGADVSALARSPHTWVRAKHGLPFEVERNLKRDEPAEWLRRDTSWPQARNAFAHATQEAMQEGFLRALWPRRSSLHRIQALESALDGTLLSHPLVWLPGEPWHGDVGWVRQCGGLAEQQPAVGPEFPIQEEPTMTVDLRRAIHTVFAALNTWYDQHQRALCLEAFYGIASSGGQVAPLTQDEVHHLICSLNDQLACLHLATPTLPALATTGHPQAAQATLCAALALWWVGLPGGLAETAPYSAVATEAGQVEPLSRKEVAYLIGALEQGVVRLELTPAYFERLDD